MMNEQLLFNEAEYQPDQAIAYLVIARESARCESREALLWFDDDSSSHRNFKWTISELKKLERSPDEPTTIDPSPIK